MLLRDRIAGQEIGHVIDQSERTVELDLSFIGNRKGAMITDGAGQREFSRAEFQGGKVRVTLKPRGGFVAVFR